VAVPNTDIDGGGGVVGDATAGSTAGELAHLDTAAAGRSPRARLFWSRGVQGVATNVSTAAVELGA